MKSNKSKNSRIIEIVIVILLILGFGYYKFIYSKKDKANIELSKKAASPTAAMKDNKIAVNKELTYGVSYLSAEYLGKRKENIAEVDKYFQQNGLPVSVRYLDVNLPADLATMKDMDFQFKGFPTAITDDSNKLTHDIIIVNKECSLRPRLYVSKGSNYQNISDLVGKQIIIADGIYISNLTYDFIVRFKLDESDFYKTLDLAHILKNSSIGTFDALLINSYTNGGKQGNTGFVSEEVLTQSFREIPANYPEVPCRGIFASKKLDKKIVDKFISVYLSAKGTLGNYKTLEKFTPADVQRILPGIDWEKIKKIRPKYLDPKLMENDK